MVSVWRPATPVEGQWNQMSLAAYLRLCKDPAQPLPPLSPHSHSTSPKSQPRGRSVPVSHEGYGFSWAAEAKEESNTVGL